MTVKQEILEIKNIFTRLIDLVFAQFKMRFGRQTAARDVLILTIGTAFAQGLMLISLPVLSRLYAPSDFGVLAVFTAASSIFATLVTGRYETSILVPAKEDEAANLVLLSFLLAISIGVLLWCISFLVPDKFKESFGLGAINGFFSLIFLTSFFLAVVSVVQGWLNRQKKYAQMAGLRIFQSSSIAGLAMLFGILSSVENGLLLSQMLACLFTGLLAFWLVRPAANIWDKQKICHVARAHNRAPKYLLPTSMLDVIALQMPVVLISVLFSDAIAGQFNMAWRLLLMPLGLVGAAIGMVFIQRFSVISNNELAAKRLLLKTWFLLFFLGLPPLLFILIFGSEIFIFFLGEEWGYSGVLAGLMMPMALAMFVSSPTSGAYIVLGLQRYNLIFGVFTAIYRPACLAVGVLHDDVELGLILWVFFDVLTLLLYQLIAWFSLGGADGRA